MIKKRCIKLDVGEDLGTFCFWITDETNTEIRYTLDHQQVRGLQELMSTDPRIRKYLNHVEETLQ